MSFPDEFDLDECILHCFNHRRRWVIPAKTRGCIYTLRAARFIYGRIPLGGVSPAYLVPLITLALSVGIIASMLGIGGGLLMVPGLIILFGFDPVMAAGTGAVTTMAVGIFTSISQRKYGDTEYRTGLSVAAGAVPAAFVGSYICGIMPESEIMLILAGLMLLASWRLLAGNMEIKKRSLPLYYYVILGAVAGLLAGMVGIGGGVLFVPILVFSGMKMHEAAATSSFIIVFSGSASATGHLLFGHVNLLAALVIILSIIPGTYIGVKLARGTGERRMRQAFGIFLILVALRLMWGAL